jgi:integrin beta 3
LTGGIESSGSFSLPVMIYRGVYNPESVYQRGDVATWGGSAWHCQENDTKTAPKEDPDYHVWKLMVKEGRGGKPGKDGDPADEKALITKILAELKRTNFDALGFYGRDPK